MTEGPVIDSLFDKLLLVNRSLSDLWNKGYRCRFDPIALNQVPLADGEAMHPKDECIGCPYSKQMEDPFCMKYLQHWSILGKISVARNKAEKAQVEVV